jgi:hypothetical protein
VVQLEQQLLRFNRVAVYVALMDDRAPSTDEQQFVPLDYGYRDPGHRLNRWLPLVKSFLRIPHHVVPSFLYIDGDRRMVRAPVGWPLSAGDLRLRRGLIRWHNRVVGRAIIW